METASARFVQCAVLGPEVAFQGGWVLVEVGDEGSEDWETFELAYQSEPFNVKGEPHIFGIVKPQPKLTAPPA